MTSPLRPSLITAIYLNSRGFGFALFEGPNAPLDWGTVEIRGKEKREKLLARLDVVFARYRPDVVVLQDMTEHGTHRPHRIRRLNETITERAEGYGFPVRFFSRNVFGDASLMYRQSAKTPSLRQPRSASRHWGASCRRLANCGRAKMLEWVSSMPLHLQ